MTARCPDCGRFVRHDYTVGAKWCDLCERLVGPRFDPLPPAPKIMGKPIGSVLVAKMQSECVNSDSISESRGGACEEDPLDAPTVAADHVSNYLRGSPERGEDLLRLEDVDGSVLQD